MIPVGSPGNNKVTTDANENLQLMFDGKGF